MLENNKTSGKPRKYICHIELPMFFLIISCSEGHFVSTWHIVALGFCRAGQNCTLPSSSLTIFIQCWDTKAIQDIKAYKAITLCWTAKEQWFSNHNSASPENLPAMHSWVPLWIFWPLNSEDGDLSQLSPPVHLCVKGRATDPGVILFPILNLKAAVIHMCCSANQHTIW